MEMTVNRTTTVQEKVELEPDAHEALTKLYGLIWVEARYDPDNQSTQKFAERLLPHIQLLNKKWGFKK